MKVKEWESQDKCLDSVVVRKNKCWISYKFNIYCSQRKCVRGFKLLCVGV